MLGNGPFCKVDAGARLFRQEKRDMLRPRARLGASTDPIQQKAQGNRDVENKGQDDDETA